VPRFIPEKLYRTFLENMPVACVDVAVVDHGSVLLVKRKDAPARGQWWVPGGRVWKGEMLRDTAARKARDEVGIECHIGPIIHTAETIFPDGPGGIAVHSINACFFAYPVSKRAAARLDKHHASHKWVRSIPAGLHPYVARCLQAAGLETASRRRGKVRAPRRPPSGQLRS
jgi:colanic acid biosynthesis protein WcaH